MLEKQNYTAAVTVKLIIKPSGQIGPSTCQLSCGNPPVELVRHETLQRDPA